MPYPTSNCTSGRVRLLLVNICVYLSIAVFLLVFSANAAIFSSSCFVCVFFKPMSVFFSRLMFYFLNCDRCMVKIIAVFALFSCALSILFSLVPSIPVSCL